MRRFDITRCWRGSSFLSGSSSVSRSSSAGCSCSCGVRCSGMVRARAVAAPVRRPGVSESARTSRKGVSPASVARTRWPRPRERVLAIGSHDGLARERDRAVVGRFRARIPGRDQRQRLAAVVELEVRRHPHEIAQVLRALDGDVRERVQTAPSSIGR